MKLSDSVYPCDTCGRMYNHDVLKKCPGCAGTSENDNNRRSSTLNPVETLDERMSEVARLLKKSIQASDRTTFAVRAVVSLAAILIMTSGAVLLLQILAALSHTKELGDFISFLSVVVALVGIFIAYSQFFGEWRMSKVPSKD